MCVRAASSDHVQWSDGITYRGQTYNKCRLPASRPRFSFWGNFWQHVLFHGKRSRSYRLPVPLYVFVVATRSFLCDQVLSLHDCKVNSNCRANIQNVLLGFCGLVDDEGAVSAPASSAFFFVRFLFFFTGSTPSVSPASLVSGPSVSSASLISGPSVVAGASESPLSRYVLLRPKLVTRVILKT